MEGLFKKEFKAKKYVPKEKDEQAAVISYCRIKNLSLMYSTNNGVKLGGSGKFGYAKTMKRGGLLKGVPDLVFPYARKGFNSLYIEMKRRSGGTISPEQKEVAELLRKEGNRVEFCKGFEEAKKVIDEYFGFQPILAVLAKE